MFPAAERQRVHASRPQRCLIAGNCVLLALCVAAASLAAYSYHRFRNIPRLALGQVLADERAGRPENFLLVGSDSRDFVQGDDDERAFGGDTAATGPPRADTLILVRVDSRSATAAMVSFPRDLWVPIAGTGKRQRINTALDGGPSRLIETVEVNFEVPVHHYVQVDFEGFRGLVDAAGGVELHLDAPVRDYDGETQTSPSGLAIDRTGCVTLDGEQALAYARSRHFQRFTGGHWEADTSGDIGRTRRQQELVRRAADTALAAVLTSPRKLTALIEVAEDHVAFDDGLGAFDILALGRRFQSLDATALQAFTLPTVAGRTDGGAAVQFLEEDQAEEVLDVFRMVGPSSAAVAPAPAPPAPRAPDRPPPLPATPGC